jgi:hypothetical protein
MIRGVYTPPTPSDPRKAWPAEREEVGASEAYHLETQRVRVEREGVVERRIPEAWHAKPVKAGLAVVRRVKGDRVLEEWRSLFQPGPVRLELSKPGDYQVEWWLLLV